MKIFVLLINGEEFRFEDNGFTAEQKANLESLAQNAFIEQPWLKDNFNQEQKDLRQENELCSWFISEAKKRFDIVLKSVNVSFIVRINK